MDNTNHETILDVKGLLCPLPVLKAKVALNRLPPGAKLRVYSTDPHSVVDFKAYCARSGHKLLEHYVKDEIYVFAISRK